MKKESDNRIEMSRRGFLKAAALTGAAICVSPALEKVQAAERAQSKTSRRAWRQCASKGLWVAGNTHFPMSDLNNAEVAELMYDWLREKGLD